MLVEMGLENQTQIENIEEINIFNIDTEKNDSSIYILKFTKYIDEVIKIKSKKKKAIFDD